MIKYEFDVRNWFKKASDCIKFFVDFNHLESVAEKILDWKTKHPALQIIRPNYANAQKKRNEKIF